MSAPKIPDGLTATYSNAKDCHRLGNRMVVEPETLWSLIERIGRVEEENLLLRGQDQTVYFHGTKRENVEGIQREGFREGTYFARHMEAAAKFGGPCVFAVNVHFERPSLDGWQVVCSNAIPAKSIIELRYVSSQDFEEEHDKLKDALDDMQSHLWCALGQPENLDFVEAIKNLVAERNQLRATRLKNGLTIARLDEQQDDLRRALHEANKTIARLSAPVSTGSDEYLRRFGHQSVMSANVGAVNALIADRVKES